MKSNNENNKHNGSNEYQKAIDFLEKGCNCGCSSRILKENFVNLRQWMVDALKRRPDLTKELSTIRITIIVVHCNCFS